MSVSIMLALQSSGSVSYNTYLVLKYKSGPLSQLILKFIMNLCEKMKHQYFTFAKSYDITK